MKKIKDRFFLSVRTCAFLALVCAPSFLAAKDIALTQEDNGRSFALDRGDTLTITLGDNPTTGYKWKIVSKELPSLTFLGHKYVPLKCERVGSPGLSIFTFKAIAQGPSALRLAYARPWMKDVPPFALFEISVDVDSRNNKTH